MGRKAAVSVLIRAASGLPTFLTSAPGPRRDAAMVAQPRG